MFNYVIAGITQLETIIKVDNIPVAYQVCTEANNAIHSSAGGDAFNISLALKWLGDDVRFMTVVGENQNLSIFNPEDREVTLDTDYVMPIMKETPVEVMLYDNNRKQQVFDDLKDIREAVYDMSKVEPVADEADMFILTNANFCRPFIKLAKDHGKKLAVKIHNFQREKEKYNEDFLKNADILYFTDNSIQEEPFSFIQDMVDKYQPDMIILGQGEKGLILYDKFRDIKAHYDTVASSQVVNLAGGDNAFFACFIHYFMKTKDSKVAMHKALLFCSHKIGYMGTSNGFMTEEQLDHWDEVVWDPRGMDSLKGNVTIPGPQ